MPTLLKTLSIEVGDVVRLATVEIAPGIGRVPETMPLRVLAHFDVDGDGVDDVTVAAGAVGMTRLQEVFVVRGGCGYSVGMFESTAQLEVRRHASRGLFDLVTNESLPSPSGVTYEVTYRFNGRAYRPIGRRRMKEPDRRSEDYLQ